jgi:hypothetical protein
VPDDHLAELHAGAQSSGGRGKGLEARDDGDDRNR